MAYRRILPFNRFGLFGLETIGAKVENNALVFEFENHPYVNAPFNGLLLIHFKSPAPAATTATMPVYFETSGLAGSRRAVTKAGGVPMTAADITIPSYNLFFYDFSTGVLEGIAGVQPEAPVTAAQRTVTQSNK